jgi:hypothetical protein
MSPRHTSWLECEKLAIWSKKIKEAQKEPPNLVNLLDETLEKLKQHGKTEADVEWVGSEEWGWFTWEEFKEIAKTVWYDNGYGLEEIAIDLVIVGKDWWLERRSCNGAEWWEFKKKPEKPAERKFPKALCIRQVEKRKPSKLKELNEEK